MFPTAQFQVWIKQKWGAGIEEQMGAVQINVCSCLVSNSL